MEVTLMTIEEAKGGLDVIKKYGPKTRSTDLTNWIDNYDYRAYTKSPSEKYMVKIIKFDFDEGCALPQNSNCCIRPVLPAEEVKKLTPTRMYRNSKGILVAEWGEYPQTRLDDTCALVGDLDFHLGLHSDFIKKTGKSYTLPDPWERSNGGLHSFCEYEYKGHKYVRYEYATRRWGWFKVRPIEWLVDEPTGKWISKDLLLSDIRFDKEKYYKGDFEKTNMHKYLTKYFAKECQPYRSLSQELKKAAEKLGDLTQQGWGVVKADVNKGYEKLFPPPTAEEIRQRDLNRLLNSENPDRKQLREHNLILKQRDVIPQRWEVLKSRLSTATPERSQRAKAIKEQQQKYGTEAAIEMSKYLRQQDNLGADNRKKTREEFMELGHEIQKTKAESKSIINKLTTSTKARQKRAKDILSARQRVVKARQAVADAQHKVDEAKQKYYDFIRQKLGRGRK